MPSNNRIKTVGWVNDYIERMFNEDFALSNIMIEGEVSNCTYNSSGHIYFSLKDSTGTLSAAMFAGKRRSGLSFNLKDGDKVVVTGHIGTYKVRGTYQLYADKIEAAGTGDLNKKYEELKARLNEMGMFSETYKKPIPKYAMKVGVVTSITGAAVHDIMQVSRRRNPFVQLYLYNAIVQGDGAAPSIISGIQTLDAMGLDVLIVGRGGGSIEDLWAFNEEEVARAIFDATTPIISAVGHEIDFTIADFVADKRAATPSQAAEMANFVYADFAGQLAYYEEKLDRSISSVLADNKRTLQSVYDRLRLLLPDAKIKNQKQTAREYETTINLLIDKSIDKAKNRIALINLDSLMDNKLKTELNKLELYCAKLDGLSPLKKLQGGYGYTGITDIHSISVGDEITTVLADGSFTSTVNSIQIRE